MVIDTGVWYLISFLIFVGLVAKPLKNIILSALVDKSAEINKELLDAKRLKEEASELLTKAQSTIAQAERDAAEIVEHAENDVERSKKRFQKELDAYVQKQNEALAQRVLEMEVSAKDTLRENMVDVAMKTATTVISQKLTADKNVEYTLHELKRLKHLN